MLRTIMELRCLKCKSSNGSHEQHHFELSLNIVSCKELDKKKHEFLRAVCGLVNDRTGGVIRIQNLDFNASLTGYPGLDDFHQKVDDSLKDIIEGTGKQFGDVYTDEWENNSSEYLRFIVRPVSGICAVDLNTTKSLPKGRAKEDVWCLRKILKSIDEVEEQISATHEANSSTEGSYATAQKSDSGTREQLLDCSFKENSYIPGLSESVSIQLKYYDVKSDDALKSKLEKNLRSYISAFAKNQQGGQLFVGVAEDYVKGSGKLSKCKGMLIRDTTSIEKYIEDLIKSRMCWLKKNGDVLDPDDVKQPDNFTVKFHPVLIENQNMEPKFVIEIAVKKFSGIVFDRETGPEAVVIAPDGSLRTLLVKEWYKRLLCGSYQHDGVILHSDEDEPRVAALIQHLKNASKVPLLSIVAYNELDLMGTSKFDCVSNISDLCRFIFVYMSKTFVNDRLKKYQEQMFLYQSVIKKEGRVIPIWVNKDDDVKCLELEPLKGLKSWQLLSAISGFDRKIENGRERFT